jgi:DNA polymerase-3 subunit delta
MPSVGPDDLPRHLQRQLCPLYVVHGDEPLLALEAGDAIRAAARAAGCTDREVIVAETHFKWDTFRGADANLGLFGERKLVDLRIPSGKPGTDGAAALAACAAHPNPDHVTLVTLPRMDRTAQAAPWFAALAAAGVTVEVKPLDRAALPGFIAARLARQGQKASPETLALLAEQGEGNLLAVRQEIEKLALLLPAGQLDHAAVEAAIADVARFDVFALSEAWLAGDAPRALRILAALRGESDPLTLVIWQLSEDVHAIAAVLAQVQRGTSPGTAVRNVRVWGKRQAALERAVRRVSPADIPPLVLQLARLDALAKGIGRGNPWDEVTTAALVLAGKPVLPLAATA